jgi:hypothetical protein
MPALPPYPPQPPLQQLCAGSSISGAPSIELRAVSSPAATYDPVGVYQASIASHCASSALYHKIGSRGPKHSAPIPPQRGALRAAALAHHH